MVVPSYEETMRILEEMKPRFDEGFSPSDRKFLAWLNVYVLGKPIIKTRCSDCYRDAYLILRNKLKTDGTMPQKQNYRLANGVLLHAFGSAEYYTLYMTDEQAETHLHQCPQDARLFSEIPDDWQQRVIARFEPTAEPAEEKPKRTRTRKPKQ